MLKLVKPNIIYKDSFLEALSEFKKEGLPWWNYEINNFEEFIQTQLTLKDTSEFWAIKNNIFVGRIALRHKLTDELKKVGGHIGYDTRPSFRGQGIASWMLKEILLIAKDLKEVLLTCNDSNQASIQVIEKNGGILKEIKKPSEDGPLKRYYLILLT